MPERPNYFSSAENRRQAAEKKHELSISHWRGELHSHTRDEAPVIAKQTLPEQIAAERKGSNCGQVPLEVLTRYHSDEMLNEFIAITNHSRDGSPMEAFNSMKKWFEKMYLENAQWLEENFHKTKEELTSEDRIQITARAEELAKKVAFYGDERLEEVNKDIDKLSETENLPIKIFKGAEVSLRPDGSFDTPMVEQGKFDIVNCSIHPNTDPEGFREIIQDPEKYTELIIKGIRHPETNTICHIGFDCPEGLVDQLDWERIAKAALENQVAIEINLNDLMKKLIYRGILDYDKFPKDSTSWRAYFEEKMPQAIPILSNPKIRGILRPYIAQGLKIAINTDEHKVKYIKDNIDEENIAEGFQKRDLRFWRALKLVEKKFNEWFDDLGISQDNIINTYSPEKLKQFLEKK